MIFNLIAFIFVFFIDSEVHEYDGVNLDESSFKQATGLAAVFARHNYLFCQSAFSVNKGFYSAER